MSLFPGWNEPGPDALGLALPDPEMREIVPSHATPDTAVQPEQAVYIPLTLPEILSSSTSDPSVSALLRFEKKLTSAHETTPPQSPFDEFNSYSAHKLVEKDLGSKARGGRSRRGVLRKVHASGIVKKRKWKNKRRVRFCDQLEQVFIIPNRDQLREMGCLYRPPKKGKSKKQKSKDRPQVGFGKVDTTNEVEDKKLQQFLRYGKCIKIQIWLCALNGTIKENMQR